MTNSDKYKRAFSALETSADFDMEEFMMRKPEYINHKRAVTLALAAALILALSISAYAVGGETIKRILGWGGNLVINQGTAEDTEVGSASVSLGALTEPVEISDGRMYFIVNDERIDITGKVSTERPFHYSYEDSEGYTHHWFIGLNSDDLESYGFAEFIKDSDGDWKGGYGHNHRVADGEAQWFILGKEDLKVPWS